MPRYAKCLVNTALGITVLVVKYYFMPVKLRYLWHFSKVQLNKSEQIDEFLQQPAGNKVLKDTI